MPEAKQFRFMREPLHKIGSSSTREKCPEQTLARVLILVFRVAQFFNVGDSLLTSTGVNLPFRMIEFNLTLCCLNLMALWDTGTPSSTYENLRSSLNQRISLVATPS